MKCTNKDQEKECSKVGTPDHIRKAAVANAYYVLGKYADIDAETLKQAEKAKAT